MIPYDPVPHDPVPYDPVPYDPVPDDPVPKYPEHTILTHIEPDISIQVVEIFEIDTKPDQTLTLRRLYALLPYALAARARGYTPYLLAYALAARPQDGALSARRAGLKTGLLALAARARGYTPY